MVGGQAPKGRNKSALGKTQCYWENQHWVKPNAIWGGKWMAFKFVTTTNKKMT
jgi:hypothetical protein